MSENEQTEKAVLVTKTVKVPIPFFFTLAANTSQTLISSPISVNFKIKGVEAHFRDDAAHNLLFYILSSNNRTTSTTTVPPDDNVVSSLSPTPYLAGESEIIELEVNYEPAPEYMYIKVFATNNNAYAITGLCVVTIEGYLRIEQDAEDIIPITEEQLQLSGQYQTEQLAKVKVILDTATSFLKGTPPFISPGIVKFGEAQTEKNSGLFDEYLRVANIPNFIPPSMPLADRYKTTRAWLDQAFNVTEETMKTSGLLNMLVSAFGGSVIQWYDWIQSTFGMEQHINQLLSYAFEKGMYRPVEYYWNSQYLQEYPSVSDLINMVVKEKITLDEFIETMKFQGISPTWSNHIWDAHFKAPEFGDIKQAFWRGTIPMEEMPDMLKRVDLDPYYNDKVWYSLLYNVPPYQDQINMRVKEVTTQEQFQKGLESLGYYGEWADRLWAAHFTPPTFADFLTAMRRKQRVTIPHADGTATDYTFGSDFFADLDVIQELSVLADYDPRYWSFFMQRVIEDPTPRQARWGYEAGSIDENYLRSIVDRTGLGDIDAKWFSEMLITFQERPFITRYLNALMSAYISGAIDGEELKRRVTEIPRREAIADWIIKIADVQKETAANKKTAAKEKLLSIADLKKAYSFGFITEDSLRTELQLLGYPVNEVDLLIQIINRTKEIEDFGGTKTALTVSEMFESWRYGQMSESTLRTELQLKGMTIADIDTLIATRKIKWGLEEA